MVVSHCLFYYDFFIISFTDHSTEDEEADADKTELITVRYTKEAAKTTPQEVEQNWFKTEFINDKDDVSVRESRKLLFCKDENVIVDVDGLNSDYSKLLLNMNSEVVEK